MKKPIEMPVLSDTMKTGHLIRWLKKPGDKINKGDVLAEIDSDKATMEIDAFMDGYLIGPLADEDSDIPVKEVIGYLSDSPSDVGSNIKTSQKPQPEKIKSDQTSEHKETQPVKSAPSKQKIKTANKEQDTQLKKSATLKADNKNNVSPYARALAADLGIDLAHVSPGKEGVIRATEVITEAIKSFVPLPDLDAGPSYTIEPMTQIRKAVAKNMINSLSIPVFQISSRIKLQPLQKFSSQNKLSFTLLIAKACSIVIEKFPYFNAAFTSKGLARRKQIDIGIAVDTGDGLITPVLRDVVHTSLTHLEENWRILEAQAKDKKLAPANYRGATFYISNLGMFESIEFFDAIVPVGASAILAIAAARDEGAMFTLSCDHRVIFGADGARFLTELKDLIENPGKWINVKSS